MGYLLDTNVCIEILRGRNLALKARLATKSLNELVLCSVVWAELQCGARLAQNPPQELARLQDAFGHWPRRPFDDSAAEAYGEIRAHLQRAGRLIGGNDLLIAAIAYSNSLTLVTHNTGEFTRVPTLPVEDWQA
ncbi:type II toxin-antitoxin system VapC family toxin [Acidithiobacillus ferrooxidans]|uniref:type II toxin-antitoxin system VapC family toxin n=1 Tax=Acidithiobacillus ferrooxidans TaxID=920 RepID=UPI000AD97936|nr:type II toxin-antitoxin system VapC family toxin [Acidithiobacillus ferrooxidans]MBU2858369.1 type II toxin-antitoxin system VapC family toxin [Acidithiobacillus ferrooxidans]MBU2861263.1 type II toxin-antitoxin system VapC family toxin [Acidithiobacillus ferrooxidans]MCR2829557.1 type II toxin-antitoxin system VapC family toxin [Acidithiobacillus ferrooxidans]